MSIEALVKGIFIIDDGIPVPFLYNPREIKETVTVNYAMKKGLSSSHPHYHYVNAEGRAQTFTMTVFDHMYVGGARIPFPLIPYVETLIDLTYPIHEDGMMISDPPTILFVFQAFVRFLKLKKVDYTFKEYSKILSPTQAVISVEAFEVVDKSKQRFNSFKNLSLKNLGF
jgi:hypothetical protein